MAVTLTIQQLGFDLRVITSSADPIPLSFEGQLRRLLAAAKELIERRAPAAPDDTQNEAVVLWAGYRFDGPPSYRGQAYASAWLNSGAAELLGPWIDRRAEPVG